MSAVDQNVADLHAEITEKREETDRLSKSSPLGVPVATPIQPIDPLESFNTRLRQSTHKQLKVFCAVNGIKIQDVVNEALKTYIAKKE